MKANLQIAIVKILLMSALLGAAGYLAPQAGMYLVLEGLEQQVSRPRMYAISRQIGLFTGFAVGFASVVTGGWLYQSGRKQEEAAIAGGDWNAVIQKQLTRTDIPPETVEKLLRSIQPAPDAS
jgi:hypothetical protein